MPYFGDIGRSRIGRHWFDRGRRRSGGPCLSEGYRLDQLDPDILVLRRPDNSDVAYFSARGATAAAIVAAKEDAGRRDLCHRKVFCW